MRYAAVCTGPDDKASWWLLDVHAPEIVDIAYPFRALDVATGAEMVVNYDSRTLTISKTGQVIPNARLAYFGPLPTEYLGRVFGEIIREYFRTGAYQTSEYVQSKR